MPQSLDGLKVAIIATDGVEQREILEPIKALREAGAVVTVVAPKSAQIQAMNHDVEKGEAIPVDQPLKVAKPESFDAVMMPGGTTNADHLRIEPAAVAFVRHFVETDKPIAAICHAPWTLIEAGGVKGHRMTSWPSLQTDLRNAGANWVDEVCVRDRHLVTSRKPADLPEFCKEMVALFSETRSRRAA
jgi:protease I